MNKRYFLLVCAFVSSLFLNAQEFSGMFGTEKIIRESCKNACVIIEKTYHLKEVKTGNLYGLNGKDEFGTVYSLGVATEEGLIVGDKVTQPWNYDSNYEVYRSDIRYEPVLYETSVKPLGEKEFVHLDFPSDSLKAFGSHNFVVPSDLDGLRLSDTTGKVDGWMVWTMHHITDEIAKETEYKAMTTFIMDAEVGNEAFEVAPPKSNYRAIGGFFVVPHITKVGCLSFELCGVARKENDKWLFSPIQRRVEKEANQEQPEGEQVGPKEETPKPEGGRLTRSRKGKKGNKK